MKRPILLAPCHDFQTLDAATEYADAIYFGIGKLNMRSHLVSFTIDEIQKVVSITSQYKKKAYLTLNSIIFDEDIEEAKTIAKVSKECNVDALIVHDMAAIHIAKEVGIPFHISTMSNISNVLAAKYYESIGARAIILARELSYEQIAKIIKSVKINVEIFVHGALCLGISGFCSLSDYIHHQSGRRGDCVQPCRQNWQLTKLMNCITKEEIIIDEEESVRGQFLSSKDLCLIGDMPMIIGMGASILKIEGRRRSPDYVNTVAKCYYEAIESVVNQTFNQDKVNYWLDQMASVFSRGFTNGNFHKKSNAKDNLPEISSVDNLMFIGIVEERKTTRSFKIHLDNTINVSDRIIIHSCGTYHLNEVSAIMRSGSGVDKAGKNETVVVQLKNSSPFSKMDMCYLWPET